MNQRSFYIFTRAGDGRDEVETILRELGPGTPESKGFHKVLHVTRAAQTVVFLTDRSSALAGALRRRPGWREPDQPETDA